MHEIGFDNQTDKRTGGHAMSTTVIRTTTDQISPYIFANTVFNQTSGTAPLVPWLYFFSIGATFLTAGDYSAASANYPGPGSPQTLGLIAPTTFDFGSPAFTSFSNLQAAYPFGTYTVTAVGNQISSTSSVSYQANYFTSTVPFVTNYSSLNGFNPANDFTVDYNSFTPDARVTTGFTFLTIWNANTHQVVFQDNFQSSSSTTALIAANTLSPNTNYTFELDFSDRLTVGSSTQGFDVRTDGSFTTGPIFQTNHAPVIDAAHSKVAGTINERPSTTGSSALDIANGFIAFTDQDLSDRPTASVVHQSVTYQDGQGHVLGLTDNQVFNFESAFLLVPESGNTNNGKIDWGYTIADKALDFLGVGETVTITSTVELNDGHGGNADQDVTVVLNGTEDLPIPAPDLATVQKGQLVAGNVLTNDTDPDVNDVPQLRVTAINGDPAKVVVSVDGRYGTLTINSDGTYQYLAKPGLGAASKNGGLDTFTYTVNDGHIGGDANTTLTIDVLGSKPGGETQGGSLAVDVAAAASEISDLISKGVPESTAFHLTDRVDPTLVARIIADVATQFGSQGNYVANAKGYVNPGALDATNPSYDQCVALVWGADKFVSTNTGSWSLGQQVLLNGAPNPQFTPGTAAPIATFVDGKYPSTNEHAAFFLGYGTEDNKAGFFMLDQSLTQPGNAGQPSIQGEPAEVRFYTFADHPFAVEYYSILV